MIIEKGLEHIHPDPNHNFPSPIMKSGLVTVNLNYPEISIDNGRT